MNSPIFTITSKLLLVSCQYCCAGSCLSKKDDTMINSNQHQISITDKGVCRMFNCQLWPSDLPLSNPFSFVNSCCSPVVTNPVRVAGLKICINSFGHFYPFGATLLWWKAGKSTVNNDITHISFPSLTLCDVTTCWFQRVSKNDSCWSLFRFIRPHPQLFSWSLPPLQSHLSCINGLPVSRCYILMEEEGGASRLL